jgi:hypothetical protein
VENWIHCTCRRPDSYFGAPCADLRERPYSVFWRDAQTSSSAKRTERDTIKLA